MPITFPRHLALYHSLHVLENNTVSRQIGALWREMRSSQTIQIGQNTQQQRETQVSRMNNKA